MPLKHRSIGGSGQMITGRKAMSDNSADKADNGGTPSGVNHIVLDVRDIEEAHRFWTEIIGL
jgi:catechol-2,3-dioxygenase